MNKPVRMAFRSSLAVGLSLLTAELLRYPHPVRAVLCASLVAGLPTFRGSFMRQRFLRVWAGAGIGMIMEAVFRDAPWFFLPAYFLMVSLLFGIGSKSRDAATMLIIAYGLSGSLENQFSDAGSEPIYGGFCRALYCTVGLLAASLSFVVFPVPKPIPGYRVRPVTYPVRDTLFLGLCATLAMCVGLIAKEYLISSFTVLGSLTWGITLCTRRDKSGLPLTFAAGIAGLLAAMAFDSVLSSSTNTLAFYMGAFLAVVWLLNWVKASFPSMAPYLAVFSSILLACMVMVPEPIQSFGTTLRIICSMMSGIVLSTVLWVIDLSLRSVEQWVETAGNARHQPSS